MAVNGRVHSIQSLGAVDGPGLRFVAFLQGCALRCEYCHNPDTWDFAGGDEFSSEEIVRRALRYVPYWKNGGGVTFTGGEPLAQADFTAECFAKLQAAGAHTALDTSGIASIADADKVLAHTSLVLADVKFLSAADYQTHARGDFDTVMRFLRRVEELKIPMWIRHVVVPNLTDGEDHIKELSKLAHSFSNLEKIELLPFRKLCLEKYEEMGIEFRLKDTPEMDVNENARLVKLL